MGADACQHLSCCIKLLYKKGCGDSEPSSPLCILKIMLFPLYPCPHTHWGGWEKSDGVSPLHENGELTGISRLESRGWAPHSLPSIPNLYGIKHQRLAPPAQQMRWCSVRLGVFSVRILKSASLWERNLPRFLLTIWVLEFLESLGMGWRCSGGFPFVFGACRCGIRSWSWSRNSKSCPRSLLSDVGPEQAEV